MNFPPGPKGFLGLKNIRDFSQKPLEFIVNLREEYGDTVSFRMGPFRNYIFYHPDQIREILVVHGKNLPKMKRQVKILSQVDGNGLVLSEGEFWQRQHRLVLPAFAAKRMAGYSKIMLETTLSRLKKWEGRSEIVLDAEMNTLTMEIITQCLFGADVQSQSAEIEEVVQGLSEMMVLEMQNPLIPPSFIPIPHNLKKKKRIAFLDKLIMGFIQKRRESGKDYGDLLSMLLLARDEETGQSKMTDKQARDEAMVLFLAGHDTTATALIWTFYLIAKNPEVGGKIRDEIARVISGKTPAFEDVGKFVYIKQVIQESLRLFPPAVGIFARQNPTDIRIREYTVPKNSLINAFSFATQRDPRWFPDPEKFDPERFAPDWEKRTPHFAYFPFGGGPRICIGMGFAMIEMTLVVATILQKYRFQESHPQKITPKLSLSVRPDKEIRLKLVKNEV